MAILYSLISVLIVSLISLVGVLTLVFSTRFLSRIVFVLVSLSVGVLFGDVFIHIIPEVFTVLDPQVASFLILAGILMFFVFEKFLHWRHSHGESDECHHHPEVQHQTLRSMVIFGDGIHNLIDGMLITASYMISIPVGVATTLAVIFHEIPQEVGNFGVLVHSGLSRGKALFYNFLSALSAFVGVGIAFLLSGSVDNFANIMLAFTAGGFIYIAGSDLVPELHKFPSFKHSLIQFVAIILGVFLMFSLVFFE